MCLYGKLVTAGRQLSDRRHGSKGFKKPQSLKVPVFIRLSSSKYLRLMRTLACELPITRVIVKASSLPEGVDAR